MGNALGVMLFDRQGVTPTIFGEIVLRHGGRMISDFQGLTREITLAKGLELAELRVSVALFRLTSATTAVGQLLQKNPKLFIEFRHVDWAGAVTEVVEGVADLGFAELSVASTNSDVSVLRRRTSSGG